jgi:hypothetical protein
LFSVVIKPPPSLAGAPVVVGHIVSSWNRVGAWLHRVDGVRFSVETKRLDLSKSAVNRYLRATMAFNRDRFWTNVSYPFLARLRYTPLSGECMRILMLSLLLTPLAVGCGGGDEEKGSADADADADTDADADATEETFEPTQHGGALALLPSVAIKVAYRQAEKDRRGFNTPANIDTCIPILEGGTDCSDYSTPDPLPSTEGSVGFIQSNLCESDDFLAYVQAYIDDPREWELWDGVVFKSDREPEDILGMPPADFIAHIEQRFEGDARACAFEQLGSVSGAGSGGITFTLTMPADFDGEELCVVTDPETVRWTPTASPYPDDSNDDGDVELMVGPSSEYTGILGEQIGNFPGLADGVQWSDSGRVGHPEYCSINGTDESVDTEYTILVRARNVPFETSSGMPFDDAALSSATVVITERCPRVDTGEWLLLGESLENDGSVRDCTKQLEIAYGQSGTTLTAFCCANPEMCGPLESTSTVCSDIFSSASEDGSSDRNSWCFETGLCCDFGDDWTPYSSF